MNTSPQSRRSPTPESTLLRELIIESVADGVLAVDRDWNITMFNASAEKITGIAREEAIGRKCFDVLRANVCGQDCPVRESMAMGKSVFNRRITIINSTGQEIPLGVNAAPLRDDRGNMLGGVETFSDLSAMDKLRRQLEQSYSYQDIIGKNSRMQQLFKILPAVAGSESTVLIEGESGTGKELFARAIHDLSPRKDGPYVIVHCGALPETLLESELFGYRKGAFTDAKQDKPGRFELARGGSIFLDEIATLTPRVQIKLLRVLEARQFEPLGGTRTIDADVRIIAATNRSLKDLVEQDEFRDDLFYRINVMPLRIPPLRDRREDLPLLIDHFFAYYNTIKGRDILGFTPEAMRVLYNYDYPGNVRELQNIIEHAFILCEGGLIDLQHLPAPLVEHPELLMEAGEKQTSTSAPRDELAEAEAAAIRAVLGRNRGDRGKTAEELGISRATLWRKMKRLGLPTAPNHTHKNDSP